MKYIVYFALLAICTPGMLHIIDWGLNFKERWWWLKLLLVVAFLSAFVALGSLAYFRAWK